MQVLYHLSHSTRLGTLYCHCLVFFFKLLSLKNQRTESQKARFGGPGLLRTYLWLCVNFVGGRMRTVFFHFLENGCSPLARYNCTKKQEFSSHLLVLTPSRNFCSSLFLFFKGESARNRKGRKTAKHEAKTPSKRRTIGQSP
jgi:hypothetical protein